MTIPEDTITRAAEAMEAADSWMYDVDCTCAKCLAERLPFALPILRDAIRAELVQEIDDMLMDDRCEVFGVNQSFPGVYGWYDGDEVQCYPSLAEMLAAHGPEVSR